MLDGWYCRSIANMQASGEAAGGSGSTASEAPGAHASQKDYSSDSSSEADVEPNYRAQYLSLKKKLKFLIYVSIKHLIRAYNSTEIKWIDLRERVMKIGIAL